MSQTKKQRKGLFLECGVRAQLIAATAWPADKQSSYTLAQGKKKGEKKTASVPARRPQQERKPRSVTATSAAEKTTTRKSFLVSSASFGSDLTRVLRGQRLETEIEEEAAGRKEHVK